MNEREEDTPSFRVHDRRRFDAEGNQRADEGPGGGSREDDRRAGAPSASPPPGAPPPDARASGPEPSRPETSRQRPTAASGSEDLPGSDEGSIGFSELVMSVATTALAYLGRTPGEEGVVSGNVNLGLARQNIDILGMLHAKTRGNLSKEEEDLLNTLLYELRTLYLDTSRSR